MIRVPPLSSLVKLNFILLDMYHFNLVTTPAPVVRCSTLKKQKKKAQRQKGTLRPNAVVSSEESSCEHHAVAIQ
jgi:hypothetical protein